MLTARTLHVGASTRLISEMKNRRTELSPGSFTGQGELGMGDWNSPPREIENRTRNLCYKNGLLEIKKMRKIYHASVRESLDTSVLLE